MRYLNRMAWLICLAVSVGYAQDGSVTLNLAPTQVGFGGVIRPGSWMPLELKLTNVGPNFRRVRCQWLLEDIDGDRVVSQRIVSLTGGRVRSVWLYASISLRTHAKTVWHVRILDDKTGKILLFQSVSIPQILRPEVSMQLVTGGGALGLGPYQDYLTQHERNKIIRGIGLDQLPDRWYGYESLNTLIWTADSVDPASPTVLPQTLQAIRQWVVRGGHLVVCLPVGEAMWFSSPLGDLLPPVEIQTLRDVFPPPCLGLYSVVRKIDLSALHPDSGADVAVLARDATGKHPVIVAHQVGFGTVTLVGIDLADRQIKSMRLPNGPAFWRAIMRWRSPAYRDAVLRAKIKAQEIASEFTGTEVETGAFVQPLVAMHGTYTLALLGVILLLCVYWLIAGPIGFFTLKYKKMHQHAWTVFVLTIGVFSVLSWGGAFLVKPRGQRVEHYSVLDVDYGSRGFGETGRIGESASYAESAEPAEPGDSGDSGDSGGGAIQIPRLIRGSSWLSLFIAHHGNVQVTTDTGNISGNASETFEKTLSGDDSRELPVPGVGPGGLPGGLPGELSGGHGNIMAASGLPPLRKGAVFLDPRTYQFRASAPGTMLFPFRSTAKQLAVRWYSLASERQPMGYRRENLPRGTMTLERGWPRGRLTHALPGPLRDILFVYCPGDGAEPWVWRRRFPWRPGQSLPIRFEMARQAHPDRLVRMPPNASSHDWGGFLWLLLGNKPLSRLVDPTRRYVQIASNEIRAGTELLSFYDTLPPPKYWRTTLGLSEAGPTHFLRSLGRELDWSGLTTLRRLILIGYLDHVPLPAPFAVEGEKISSVGTVAVRCVFHLPSPRASSHQGNQ